MSRRFFTADFHLGMSEILRFAKRGAQYGGPFSSIDDMNKTLLYACCCQADEEDTIIHVGDLFQYNDSMSENGMQMKPIQLIKKIPATFVNIRGNHDAQNKVKSLCDSLQTKLGIRYPNVTVGHYPSYNPHAQSYVRNGWIHLCGHVHGRWKHCLDLDRQILNINVGVDVWGFQLVSEEQLIQYVDKILRAPKERLNKVRTLEDGRIADV